MATFQPDTVVYLCSTQLKINNKNQLTFANANEQYQFFMSNMKYQFTDFSYQRQNNRIRVPIHIDKLWNCNYVMYQNKHYTNKWFYAYITRLEYKNENVTDVFIQTDAFQTWQFDITYKESFIEREMIDVSNDVPRK